MKLLALSGLMAMALAVAGAPPVDAAAAQNDLAQQFADICLKPGTQPSSVAGQRIDSRTLTEPFASYFKYALNDEVIEQGDVYIAFTRGPTSMGGAVEIKCMVAGPGVFSDVRAELSSISGRQSEPDYPGSALNGKLAMWVKGGDALSLTSFGDGSLLLQSRKIFIALEETR
jgi:hypothetical protein